jgi:hypothetical protein
MAGAPCCSTQRGRRGEELERCWDLTRAWNWVEVHASSGSERANASSGSERAKGSAVGVGLGYQAHWSACQGQCNFFILALKKNYFDQGLFHICVMVSDILGAQEGAS